MISSHIITNRETMRRRNRTATGGKNARQKSGDNARQTSAAPKSASITSRPRVANHSYHQKTPQIKDQGRQQK